MGGGEASTGENEMLQKVRAASQSPTPVTMSSELEKGLAEFRRKLDEANVGVADDGSSGLEGVLFAAREVFAKVLVADFFAIVGFLVWFLAANVQKEFMGNVWLLKCFQDIFMPVVQPALGLLMWAAS